MYLAIVLVDWWLMRAAARVLGRTSERLLHALRIKVFAHLQRLGVDFYEREMAGRIMTRMTTDIDALSLLSEAMNFDFASKGLDEPFTDDELDGISGTQSMRDRVVAVSGIKNPTPRDFIKYSRRARPNKPFVGGPKEVADGLEEWFSTGVCDGFVVAATHSPGTYAEFVKYVIPELQRRGLYHKDYRGATLRENLGLPIPRHGMGPGHGPGHGLGMGQGRDYMVDRFPDLLAIDVDEDSGKSKLRVTGEDEESALAEIHSTLAMAGNATRFFSYTY